MLIRGLSVQSATIQALAIAELSHDGPDVNLMETPEQAQAAFAATFGSRKQPARTDA